MEYKKKRFLLREILQNISRISNLTKKVRIFVENLDFKAKKTIILVHEKKPFVVLSQIPAIFMANLRDLLANFSSNLLIVQNDETKQKYYFLLPFAAKPQATRCEITRQPI